jgi:hypothetical protein
MQAFVTINKGSKNTCDEIQIRCDKMQNRVM